MSLRSIPIPLLVSSAAAFGATLTFAPDATFRGSDLPAWHSSGEIAWKADRGEIAVDPNGGVGWLALSRSYQDVALHGFVRCAGACKAGILLRLAKTNSGTEGIFVSLTEGDLGVFLVDFDADGKETARQKLRRGGGAVRIAPPPPPGSANTSQGGERRRPAGSQIFLPVQRPDAGLRAGDWNEFEVALDANIVRMYVNGSGETGGVVESEGYGPIALYAGGTGEVRFKDLAYKDIGVRTNPKEEVSPNYRMQRLSDMYYSWSAAAADFNHDGVTDIVAGPHIFFGPDFTTFREVYPAQALSPSKEFTGVNCQYAYDFNGDGWPDILTGPPRATVYINPKGESRRWNKYEVVPQIQSEITLFQDIDGDGKPELIYASAGAVRYAKPDPADATKPWTVFTVSEPGYANAHGLGVGDINGDGHIDIVNPFGWWEQPASKTPQQTWTYHPAAFARYGRGIVGGSVMAVYDVNGDGMADVVTSLNAHGFGLAWFEQKRDKGGAMSFVQHMISDDFSSANAGGVTFSEPHGSTVADVNGDGIPDFVVGKRYFSHLEDYLDPDPFGPAVLYVYKTRRNPKAPGGAEFVPELIHNRSGAGSDLLVTDLNHDGVMDIVTSTDRGTFVFWGKPRAK